MKPSERRALEAEKRARQAAEFREKELQREAEKAAKREKKKIANSAPVIPQEERQEQINVEATYTKLPEEPIDVKGDGYHREGFFSNHSRLIAFIITAALVIFVIGPLGIDMLVAYSRGERLGQVKNEGRTMTVDDLINLSAKGDSVTWVDLDDYRYTDSSYTKEKKTTYNHKYYIYENDSLCLEVIGSDKNQKPDIVRLIDYESGDFIDIRIKDARAFLKDHGYIEKGN